MMQKCAKFACADTLNVSISFRSNWNTRSSKCLLLDLKKKRNMYYPITPKADIHNVICTVLFHCPINAEIRAAEGQSDQSCSVTLCLVCLKEYCYFCMSSSINKCFVSIIILFFLIKGEKSLKDEDELESFNVKDGGRLFLKDLAR